MKLIRKLYAMFLVCLGDLASAAIIAPILIIVMDYHAITAELIFVAAIILSVLPDLDIPLHKLLVSKKPEDIGNHRNLLHKPIFIIPVFLLLHLLSAFWAYLVGLCLLAHFIHDSTGSGYGIKWFWPFSEKTYKFCSKRSIICKWTPEEMAKIQLLTLDEWLEKYYLKWTSESIAGVILAIIALAVIFWFTQTNIN